MEDVTCHSVGLHDRTAGDCGLAKLAVNLIHSNQTNLPAHRDTM